MTQPPPVPPGRNLDALAPPPETPPRRDPLAPPPPWTGPPTVILRYAEVDTALLPVVEPGPPPNAPTTPTTAPPHRPAPAPPGPPSPVARPGWPAAAEPATLPAAASVAAPPAAASTTSPPPFGTPSAAPGPASSVSDIAAGPAAGSGTGQPGWWRRNRWGLLALLPVLVLALGPGVKDGYEQYSRNEYLEPVGAGADGWASFAGARIRLVELVAPPALPARVGRPVPMPTGVRVWRATLAFELPAAEALSGCLPYLEDRDGRLFSANPAELTRAGLPIVQCVPDDPAQRSLQTQAYFVLPPTATPAALRVLKATERPRYARLPVG